MQELSANELRELLEAERVHLIDVREPYEHEEFNIGGTNIPLADLVNHEDKIKTMSAQRDIVLYCRSGNRSAVAQKLLAMRFGIENTLNLTGGVIAWKKENS
jgi:rhodanese-related sulfurtransferase